MTIPHPARNRPLTGTGPVLALCLLAFAWPRPASAQTDVISGGVSTAEGRHVLLDVPHVVEDRPVIAVEIVTAGAAAFGHAPDGWQGEATSNGIRMGGVPLAEGKGKFRLDLPAEEFWKGSQVVLYGPEGELLSGPVVPPVDYPELEVLQSISGVLIAPGQASTGELVRMEITDEELVGLGRWRLSGTPIRQTGDSERLQGRIPAFLRPGDFAEVTYENAYGLEQIVDSEAIEIVGTTEDEEDPAPPALTGCTPRVFRGRVACVCGTFPTTETQSGLFISGQPLGQPAAASSRVVHVRIPETLAPGLHTITGEGIEGAVEITVLAVRGEIDLQRILQGGSTPLRVVVEGTTDPLDLRLENLAPSIIELEGGAVQTAQTSGGETNALERTVTGLSTGPFDVFYELAEEPCPCLESEVLIAENDGGTRTRDGGEPSDSTRTRPPWWPPEEDDVDDPRDVPPPVIYGEEEDPEEPSCCGFRGPLLLWPQTSDPLAQADPMLAPHHAAVGATQVHLATGAYFQNDRDIAVDAVGLPFELTRHYTSDLETFSGGVLGHKWDFNYNKRLVALGRDYADGLRGQVAGIEQSVVMLFDGMGRVLRYVEASSDLRNVLNFGVRDAFEAYVTTYVSPAGEFDELQRYVVTDPSQHPFAGHPDVDKGEQIFYVVREKNGIRYVYNCRGQLLHILARNDYASLPAGETRLPVRYTFLYRGLRSPLTQNNTLSSIEDPSGHTYSVSTVDIDLGLVNTNDDCIHITGTLPIPRIHKIVGAGVEVEYVYRGENTEPVLEQIRRTYNGFDRPTVVTETRYTYDDAFRLESVIAPEESAGRGRPYIANTYDGAGRVTAQRLAGEPHAAIAYLGNVVTVTHPVGSTARYRLVPLGDYRVIASETTEGAAGAWTTSYTHNGATQITAVTMPRGNRMVFVYDDGNAPVTLGPMRNDVTAGVTYHSDLSKGNLLELRREAGSLASGGAVPPLRSQIDYEPLYNQVAEQTDPGGAQTNFVYAYDHQGVLGNAVEEKGPDLTQPDGSVVAVEPRRFEYTDRGQLEAEAASPADVTTYAYNSEGYLSGVSGPRGSETFVRDLFGRILSRTGPEGAVNYALDARGLVYREIRDPYGFANERRYRYDLNADLVAVEVDVEDNFRSGESLVPGHSAPAAQSQATSTVTHELDLLGRPVKETTTSGGLTFVVTRRFDALGRVVRAEEPSPEGGALVTTFSYDARGNLTEERSAGPPVRHRYDENGNLVETEIGTGQAARRYAYRYDPFDREVENVSPVGTVTRVALDANDNVLEEEVRGSDGSQEGTEVLLTKTGYRYNEQNLLVRLSKHVLDGAGSLSETTYSYDAQARLTAIEVPGRVVSRFRYDAAGRVVEQTDPESNQIRTEYDAHGRPAAIEEVEVERAFDVGSRAWSTEEKTYRTELTYDALGRVASSSAPGARAAYRYDSRDRKRLSAVEHLGVTETRFDGLGRQSRVESAGRVQTFSYTPAGQMAEMTGPGLHQRWTYDAQGLVVAAEDVLAGARTTIRRDEIGNPELVTDPNGTVIRRTFNALGLPVREDIGLGSVIVEIGDARIPATAGPGNVWRRYDGVGRLRYAQNGNYSWTRSTGVGLTYDGLGRIVRETQARDVDGQTIERRYAPDNTWFETRFPEITGSPVVRRHLDRLGRITRVDLDGEMVASYAYSGIDRVAARSTRNGTVSTFTYDGKRRMTEAYVWAEAGTTYETPAIIWNARATYTDSGRLATMLAVDQGLATSSMTRYTYDARGRTTESVTTTSTAGSRPSETVSRLMTTFSGDRPSVQAEFLTDTQGERPAPVFARVQRFEYDGPRVAAVTTTARNRFGGGPIPDLATPDELQQWISGDGSFTDRQHFAYDAAGNLVKDDANVYAYNADGQLTRVAQIPGNRPYNQSIHFQYDPLGRRTRAYPARDRAPSGFAEFQPWNRHPVWFLYDGPDAVGEVIEATDAGTTLLARYVPGARPGERVRMDRRTDDDPAGAFTPFYLHGGLQGQIALITDGDGRPLSTYAPSSNQAGGMLAPPDEMRLITGSKTRSPYIGWTTRIDGFSGVKYDEQSGRAVYDYRTSSRLAEALDLQAYRASITAMQNRGALALGVATMAAIAPAAAAFEGLINVGLNWFAASWAQSPYTPGEAAEHFAEGVLSGGLGKLVPGGSSAVGKYAADYATDFTAGMAFDVAWRGRSWNDAVADNIVGAAASASLATGLRLGYAGASAGARSAAARLRPVAEPAVPVRASGANPVAVQPPHRNVVGDVFDSVLGSKFRSLEDNGFQAEILHLLLNGRAYHRYVAGLILRRDITVHWDANMSRTTFGEWHPMGPTAIYLNPRAFRSRHPNAALEAASTIVHEVTHALGGGEPAAHLAQGAFLHYWTMVKGRKGAAGFPHAGAYVFSRHSSETMKAFMASQHLKTPLPLYQLLRQRQYGHKHAWFYREDEILSVGRLHSEIFKKGGWGKVLHLDPALDRALSLDAANAQGWTY